MIRLRFNSLAGTDPAIIGPAPFFRIEGPLLHQGPNRLVVGRYFDHHWEMGGRFVSSYEFMDVVHLHFEGADGSASQAFGPFEQVRFPNGSCYADRTLFAELVDEHGTAAVAGTSPPNRWLHRGDASSWSALVVTPAVKPR